MIKTIPISNLAPRGANAPINDFSSLDLTTQGGNQMGPGAARIQADLDRGIALEALVVNKRSDVLVVGLHGAVDRSGTELPRFERLKTLLGYDVSTAYFSDPTLHLDDRMQLSWYTGWEGIDVQAYIAGVVDSIASMVGASKVIFIGSSGGGFAALQISALLHESVALAFNAQTSIANYRVGGTSWGVQRHYVLSVWPEVSAALTPPGHVEAGTWECLLDDRVSAIRRYSAKRENRVYLVQNSEEFHYEEHFLPFVDIARSAGNDIIPLTNREGPRHNPPLPSNFKSVFEEVLAQVRGEK